MLSDEVSGAGDFITGAQAAIRSVTPVLPWLAGAPWNRVIQQICVQDSFDTVIRLWSPFTSLHFCEQMMLVAYVMLFTCIWTGVKL